MKQPVVRKLLQDSQCEPGSFDFTSRLEFEAKCNLLRSRSDTCLGKQSQRYQTNISVKINPWTVPTIDFTFHNSKSKNIRFGAKKSQQHHKKPRNKEFVRIPLPKALEKPVNNDTKFVTSFRSPSARTARIIGVKEGKYPAGPYKPRGPHAFRDDEFRPVSVWFYCIRLYIKERILAV